MADQRRDPEQRPSPDALLEAARRAGAHVGRLKIFVGAAPGVGKTYEMLQTARAKREEGVDVVAGVVETHGRKETEALLEGLEVLPRKPTVYVNRILSEFDIDAAIRRRPSLILVDELAHTNIPGSRHAKRYQDVEELLENGIDVYTTVNIQHIESLNDVVAQITGVRVRETVPDAILDRADAVELVDLTPDDLIQRLKEGKVYVPKQAERALKNYFSPTNLTALRELALRRTAERVDEQLLEQMQAQAISGPWAAGERILVCVSEDPKSAGLVRYAKRLADRLHAPWTALCIETRRSLQFSEKERDRLAETMRRGRAARRRGHHPPRRRPQHRRRRAGLRAQAERHAHRHRQVHALALVRDPARLGGARPGPPRRQHRRARHPRRGGRAHPQRAMRRQRRRPMRPSPSIRSPTLPRCWRLPSRTGIGRAMQPMFGIENVDLVLLMAIVGIALRFGLLPSLLATVAASLCYNFFFLPPIYTFTITDPTNVAAFVLFTMVAVVVSNMAARGRTHTVTALERVRTIELLYAFSRKLAGVGPLDDALWATTYQTALMLKVRVVLLLPEDGAIAVKAGYPPEDTLEEADLAAARWAWEKDRTAGRDSDTLPGAKWLFLPMRTGPRHHRHPRHRPRRTRPAADGGPAPPAGCADRSGRAWRSSACAWSRTSTGSSARWRPSACARRSSPRSRTTSRRRWPPCSAPRARCATWRDRWTTPPGRICLPPSSTRPSGSTGSSPTCWT